MADARPRTSQCESPPASALLPWRLPAKHPDQIDQPSYMTDNLPHLMTQCPAILTDSAQITPASRQTDTSWFGMHVALSGAMIIGARDSTGPFHLTEPRTIAILGGGFC